MPMLLPICLAVACLLARSLRAAPATADAVREIAGGQVRIVWCQDLADGAHAGAGAQPAQRRLMGFDTDDGRGERAILAAPADYSRPLLTPRGDRVIFSRPAETNIYLVNWDGSHLRRLARGFALAVWRDPADGVEWVYGAAPVPGSDTLQGVQRAPLDRPGQVESVWNRRPLHPDNFMVSADGRLAGGVFPWPHCGLAELPDGHWQKYGEGCWPALAPGNRGLFWIFDGAHRNLTLFRLATGERWTVNINRAPGIGGFEVYHPRWSNHERFLVMTGPYKLGDGSNRIRAGGPEVEIHLGRFDREFRAVESWVRVTDNRRADFFPDAWLAAAAESAPAATGTVAAAGAAPAAAAWPVNPAGLVFLWENRAGNNDCPGPAGAPARVSRVEPRGRARYGRHLEMDLAHGVFAADHGSGDRVLAALRHSGQLGLEAVLTARPEARPERAAIVSLAGDAGMAFGLEQRRDRLVFRLLNTVTVPLGPLPAGAPSHLALNCAGGRLTAFLNGMPWVTAELPAGNLEAWQSAELRFGDADAGWPGTLDHVAIFDRARDPAEIRRSHQILAPDLQCRRPAGRVTVEARLARAAVPPTPEAIAPYRRALLADHYDQVQVLQGQCADREFLAARWVILDGRPLPESARTAGQTYRLTLEAFDDHPELEGERLIRENDDIQLPLLVEWD